MFFQIDLEKILAHKEELFYLEQIYRAQLRYENVIYIKRESYNRKLGISFETGGIFIIKIFGRVLVKAVLFQLRGRGHPQDDSTPNLFPDSKSSKLGLLNEVSFVSEFLWKCSKYLSSSLTLLSSCPGLGGPD